MLIGSLQLTAIRKVEAIWRRLTRKGMVRKMIMVSPCSKILLCENHSFIPHLQNDNLLVILSDNSSRNDEMDRSDCERRGRNKENAFNSYAAETVGTVRSHRLQWIRGGRVFVCGVEVYCGGNWKITAGPHRSLPGMHKVQIRLQPCFKFTSRIWFLQMPTLLEMNYLSRVWIMLKTLPWITFSASVAFSLVISISLHFPPINNEMTPLEMQDRWLKWDIIFVETTQEQRLFEPD